MTDPTDPSNPPVQLDKPRCHFLESLEGRLHDIQSLWIAYQSEPSAARLQAFHMATHRLKCGSGLHGYLDLHVAASRVEKLLIDGRADRRLLSSGEAERVTVAIRRLAMAERTLVVPQLLSLQVGMNPSRHRGALYLLEDDPNQASRIMAQLAAHGYSLIHLETMKGLREACVQAVPDAIIADIGLMLPKGEESIEEGRSIFAGLSHSPPVLFTSMLRDGKTRLAALRAGGQGYFVKPLDYTGLLLQMEELLRLSKTQEAQRVLIVDDDAEFVALAEQASRAIGFASRIVADPKDVIDAMYEFQPHVVVLDLFSSVIDGVAAVRLLQQERQFVQIPILFVTVFQEFVTAFQEADRGFWGLDIPHHELLKKPLNMVQFQSTLKSLAANVQRRFDEQHFLSCVDPATGFHWDEYFSRYMEAVLCLENDQHAGHWVACVRLMARNGGHKAWKIRHHRAVFGSETRLASAVLDDPVLGDAGPWGCLFIFKTHVQKVAEACQKFLQQLLAGMRCRLPELGSWEGGVGVVYWNEGAVPQLQQQASTLAIMARSEAQDGVRLSDLAAARIVAEHDKDYWRRELEHCIEERRLFCLFQPIASFMGDHVSRYGVLLRLRSRERDEVLRPELFLMQADLQGLFPLINCWLVANALHQISRREQKRMPTELFVQVSRHSIRDRRFVNWLDNHLRQKGGHPQACVLTFQQADLRDNPLESRNCLMALHGLGFQIMLDRFDGSEAGFQCLGQLPVNIVRLAPNLVFDLRERQASFRDMANIVDRLHEADVKVLVGFVEDSQILSILFQQQVDMVQGFFLAMPDMDMDYEFQTKLG